MNNVKNLKWLVVILILAFMYPSCQKDNQEPNNENLSKIELKESPEECDVIVDLIAGQFTDVGSVMVTHDGINIYVTYYIDEPGWCLKETHLHVASNFAGIPQTKSGNPKVGHFQFKSGHDCVQSYMYTVPIIWALGAEVVVAAHAVVAYDNAGGDALTKAASDESSNETAWGDGLPFPGNNWAMYFDYTICSENGGGLGQESEIAYAYAPPESGIVSECFLTSQISNKWGWHIGQFGESYTFELWALPHTCVHSTGFHVGTVEVVFKGGNKVDVTYTTFPGYSLDEAHLWVSDEPWSAPPMVDPEDFPYHAWDLSGVMTYTFKNVTNRGQMFMIAHALVYGVIHSG